jgi:hypothetical protein
MEDQRGKLCDDPRCLEYDCWACTLMATLQTQITTLTAERDAAIAEKEKAKEEGYSAGWEECFQSFQMGLE